MAVKRRLKQRFDVVVLQESRGSTIVLYSEGGTHAAQGWFLLRARGFDHVVFLRGGLFEWVDHVMEARIGPNATQAERDAFREVAERGQTLSDASTHRTRWSASSTSSTA